MTAFIDMTLTNDGFWPDVSVRAWVEGWRVPMDAKEEMLRLCLLQAIIDTNDALKSAKLNALAAGKTDLESYADALFPDELINDQAVLTTLYMYAVGNLAKAKTIVRIQAQARRQANEGETVAADNTQEFFQDEYQNSISRILQRMAPATSTGVNFGFYVASL